MAFFNRKLYRQKPKQWGKPSVVQPSIFANAERAGIDPAGIPAIVPLWEKAGDILRNYGYLSDRMIVSGDQNYNPSDLLWEKDGLNWSSDSYYFKTPTNIIIEPPYYFWIKFIQLVWPGEAMIGVSDGSNGSWLTQSFADTGIRFGSHSGNIQAATRPVVGESSVVLAYQKSASEAKIYQNGILSKAGNNGYTTYDNTPFTIHYQGGIGIKYIYQLAGLFKGQMPNDLPALAYDNPYFLLHRQPSVFYSVPSGAITYARPGRTLYGPFYGPFCGPI